MPLSKWELGNGWIIKGFSAERRSDALMKRTRSRGYPLPQSVLAVQSFS